MFLTAGAAEAGAAMQTAVVAAIVEPTSDKLTALREQRKVKFTEAMSLEYGTKEQNDALTSVFKIDGDIRAEIAAIKAQESAAKLADLRNEQVAKLAERDNAMRNLDAVKADKKATPEKLAEAQGAFDILNEPIVNALLSKFGTVKPVTIAADGTAKPAGTKGSTGTEIHDKLLALINGGVTPTEACKTLVAEGYARGTVGSIRTAMKEAGEVNG